MREHHHSFQYKWEESTAMTPSAVHHDKNSTLLIWAALFFIAIFGLFFFGYKKLYLKSETALSLKSRDVQSFHSFGLEAFLVRIPSKEGQTALTKIKTQFFVKDIRVQSELLRGKTQYKEHLIFLLSKSTTHDFFEEEKKQNLEEKIKNHINSFLSTGRVQRIEIKSQFI